MKVYIAGPMRGQPYFNRAAFDQVAKALRAQGLTPVSPIDLDLARCPEIFERPGAEHGVWDGSTPQDYLRIMAEDLEILAECDAVVLLSGWADSVGASIEHRLSVHLPQVFCVPSEQGQVPYRGRSDLGWTEFDGPEPWAQAANWLRGLVVPADTVPEPTPSTGEVRAKHSTGGEKGRKPVQFSRLPRFVDEVAAHFFKGAKKYPDVAPGRANWSLGYPWSWSFDALCRHLWAWWHGEDEDTETGSHHLAAVGFHVLVLGEFQRDGLGLDDRPKHHRGLTPVTYPGTLPGAEGKEMP